MKIKRLIIIFFCAIGFSTISANDLLQKFSGKITYVVDAAGGGDYTKVQDAINAVPNNSATRTVIFIKNGAYYEKINIGSSKINLMMIGEDVDSTIVYYDDYSGKTAEYNTFNSETFRVNANDFWAMNFTIKNSSFDDPNGDVTQAPALYTDGDRQVFLHVKLWGFQDTYYSRSSSNRAYFKDCFIAGTVDYIFGEAVILFDSCQIHNLRKSGGYTTAASTEQGSVFGYVFKNCRITAPAGVRNFHLGRPWKTYAKTVFYNCYEGESVHAEGWKSWDKPDEGIFKDPFYAEYKCFGPGSDTTKRVAWGYQLSDAQAADYTISNIYAAANSSHLSTDWMPNVDADELYQIIRANVDKYLAPINVNSTLQDIKIDNSSLDGFHKDSIEFVVELPSGTVDVPVIEAIAENDLSTVTVTYPDEVPGFATIDITSRYEASTNSISMFLSVDNAYSDATLDSISFNKELIQGFDPNKFEYYVGLPEGTSKFLPVKVYRSVDDARFRVTKPDVMPGVFTILITAVDGVTTNTYTINTVYGVGVDNVNGLINSFYAQSPINDIFRANVNLKSISNVELQFYNIVGSLIKSQKFDDLLSGKNDLEINVNDFENGIYIYRLNVNGQIKSGKFIKK